MPVELEDLLVGLGFRRGGGSGGTWRFVLSDNPGVTVEVVPHGMRVTVVSRYRPGENYSPCQEVSGNGYAEALAKVFARRLANDWSTYGSDTRRILRSLLERIN